MDLMKSLDWNYRTNQPAGYWVYICMSFMPLREESYCVVLQVRKRPRKNWISPAPCSRVPLEVLQRKAEILFLPTGLGKRSGITQFSILIKKMCTEREVLTICELLFVPSFSKLMSPTHLNFLGFKWKTAGMDSLPCEVLPLVSSQLLICTSFMCINR